MRSHFKRELQFIPHRRVFLGISCVLVILAVIGLLVRGLVFGIEFQGGTTIDFHNTGEVTIDQMRSALSAAGETDPVVQTTQSESGSGFLVRSETTDPNVANDHAAKAGQSLGLPDKSYTVTTIGPDWGQDITRASAFAFGIAIVLIIAYVSLRYEFKMSITAVLALMHDLVITLGIYAWAQVAITPNVVAALLTIMGYSLYDTVVEFNRMDENAKHLHDGVHVTYYQICNFSINEVIVRTINTTITSVVPVCIMLILGGETLKDFALAMLIGELLGTWSSFGVASPLLAMWKTREKHWAKLEAKDRAAKKAAASATSVAHAHDVQNSEDAPEVQNADDVQEVQPAPAHEEVQEVQNGESKPVEHTDTSAAHNSSDIE